MRATKIHDREDKNRCTEGGTGEEGPVEEKLFSKRGRAERGSNSLMSL